MLGTQVRERMRSEVTPDRQYEDKVSTVVHGDRVFYEVVEARGETGSAGLAVDVSELEAMREELARTLRSHAETLDHLATPSPSSTAGSASNSTTRPSSVSGTWTRRFSKAGRATPSFSSACAPTASCRSHIHGRVQGKDLAVYQSVDPQPHLGSAGRPDAQRFANAHPQGGATWVFDDLTRRSTWRPATTRSSRSRAKRSTTLPRALPCSGRTAA